MSLQSFNFLCCDCYFVTGLNGAMANVGVSQSPPHHSHSRRRHGNVLDLFPDELFAHPDSRKRNTSPNDVHMDSPSHKRKRLL